MGRGHLRRSPVILLLFLLPLCSSRDALKDTISYRPNDPSHSTLPQNFLFGTASSAYQYEGAYLSDGKGLANWDVFSHEESWHVQDGSNGDVAVDHYHRYLEDIGIMESIGVNAYRFSISWARILPKGRFGEINLKGVDFYNRLIDAMLSKGIQPFVTLTHFDYPQELDDRYMMWLSPESIKDFAYYADICFKNFGDRVKYWTTFNEPNFQAGFGYRVGEHAPGRCSKLFGNCTDGDSETEPFIVAHNMILAHSEAVSIYKTKYQEQGGMIGIVVHSFWFEPFSNSTPDILAAQRAQAFLLDWFLEPIIHGRYPRVMEEIVGSNLPRFSSAESLRIKTMGLDFIGLNQYSAYFVKDCLHSVCATKKAATRTEGFLEKTSWSNGVPIGEPTTVNWQYIYPEGIEKTVNYVKERYNNTPMFLTENGFGEVLPNCTLDNMEECLNDHRRVNYMADYTKYLMKAIRRGADVRGYFVWSLLDNFEWTYGYTVRFGIFHIDYATLKRIPRLSAKWYKEFIAKHKSYPSHSES